MIGKLHRKGDHWVIRYKMEDDLIATDGGEISLHPDNVNGVLAADIFGSRMEGREVEFQIVPHMHDTFVAKLIDEDDDSPEPNEALKSAKERYDRQTPPYVSDDFQIGPDGTYKNIRPYSTPYEDAERIVSYFKNYRFHISQMDITIMSTKVVDEILMALDNVYTSKEFINHYKSVKEEIKEYNLKKPFND
jgi:hypothetical protein